MRLFESIVEANHKAVAGDASAGLHLDEFAKELPIIALTCIDPRLNAFFPNILGIPARDFIWLRNAGNVVTGPLDGAMRSLALACAVKGGKEIAIIGHTDCQVARTPMMELLEKFKALGVDRGRLPDNLNEFFGKCATERQNIINACDLVRQSPLIGPNIPVHGLLADVETGKLDWLVNGYQKLNQAQSPVQPSEALPRLSAFGSLKDFEPGEMKFPTSKIGEWVSSKAEELKTAAEQAAQKAQPVVQLAEATIQAAGDFVQQQLAGAKIPPKIPAPPPTIRPPRAARKR
ncbi:MAG: carbonic anhydrase [Limisphaerales bacterium]